MQFAVSVTGDQHDPNATSAVRNRGVFVAIAVLAVAGILVSAVSLQRHYAKSATAFCDVGERFNCDIVNRSEQSTVMGIPVAGIGVVGYGVLLILATAYRSRAGTPNWLLALALVGSGFSVFLTLMEVYVLETWCILCLTSQGLIVAITLLAGVAVVRAALHG